MKKLIKWYLVRVAEAPFSLGFVLIGIPCVVIGVMGAIWFDSPYTLPLLSGGLLGGIALGIVQTFFCRRYVACDTTARELVHRTFIVVDEQGELLDTGNPIWKGRDHAYPCDLPRMDEQNTFEVLLNISCSPEGELSVKSLDCPHPDWPEEGEGDLISVEVLLTAHLIPEEFPPEALYSVVGLGHRGIEGWLAHIYLTATEEVQKSAFTQLALAAHETQGPFALAELLTDMLQAVSLSAHDLSNILGVKATVKATIIAHDC